MALFSLVASLIYFCPQKRKKWQTIDGLWHQLPFPCLKWSYRFLSEGLTVRKPCQLWSVQQAVVWAELWNESRQSVLAFSLPAGRPYVTKCIVRWCKSVVYRWAGAAQMWEMQRRCFALCWDWGRLHCYGGMQIVLLWRIVDSQALIKAFTQLLWTLKKVCLKRNKAIKCI